MTTTFVAGLRIDGLSAPMLLEGPMDGDAFLAYVEQVLAPTLAPGETVVMDNLPAHKVRGVREAIEAAGADLRYLPAYSPDFNPIEMAFSNSRPSSAPQPNAPWTAYGTRLPRRWTASNRWNARTTSQKPVTMQYDRKIL